MRSNAKHRRGVLGTVLLIVVTPTVAGVGPASAATCTGLELYGHRGYVYPDPATTDENTIAAFNGAVSQGASGVETDLYRLNQPGADPARISAIVHDPTWDRTIDAASMAAAGVPTGTDVTATTYAQKKQLRTKGGQPVPSLARLTAWSANHPAIPVMIEVKSAFTLAEVKQIRPTSQMSFYGATWSWVRPFEQAGYPVGVRQNVPWSASRYQTNAITFVTGDLGLLSASEVATIHGYGLGITVSTNGVDSTPEFDQALADGFDRLVVDSPAAAVAWVASGCP